MIMCTLLSPLVPNRPVPGLVEKRLCALKSDTYNTMLLLYRKQERRFGLSVNKMHLESTDGQEREGVRIIRTKKIK